MRNHSLLAASFLATAALYSSHDFNSRLNELEKEVSAIRQENVEGTVGGKNPSSQIQAKGTGFFLTADFLIWKAHADGIDYVFKGIGNSNTNITNGKLISPKSHWDHGVRFGIGYLFPSYDGWDIDLIWTHFHAKARDTQRIIVGEFITPTFDALSNPVNFSSQPLLGSNAIWKLMYNVLDLELGRATFVSRALSIRPFIGVRGAWISQDLNVTYNSSFLNDAFAKTEADNNFRAVGLRGGLDLNYYVTKNWSLYGKASASLLYGSFHVNTVLQPNFRPQEFPNSSLAEIRQNLRRTRINFEGGAGVQWEIDFMKNRYHLALSAGYEMIDWLRLNQIKEPFGFNPSGTFSGQYIPRRGNLDLQGGTLSARLDF